MWSFRTIGSKLWCVEQEQDCGQSHKQTDRHRNNVNTIVSLWDYILNHFRYHTDNNVPCKVISRKFETFSNRKHASSNMSFQLESITYMYIIVRILSIVQWTPTSEYKHLLTCTSIHTVDACMSMFPEPIIHVVLRTPSEIHIIHSRENNITCNKYSSLRFGPGLWATDKD